MRRAAITLLLLSFASTLFADSYEKIRTLRDRAKEAIASGNVSAERDIAPLIEMLRKSRDDEDQRHLVDAIVDLGEADGSSPSAIKHYIIDNMTPILLALAADRKNSTFLRGDAIHGLRNVGASREALEQVTAMALKDPDEYVKSRGEILENYIKSMPAGSTMASIKTVDPEKEREAIAFLRSRRLGVSAEQLNRSAMEAKPDEVSALLAAGVDVNSVEHDDPPLVSAMRACSDGGESDDIVKTIDLLVTAGADVKRTDDNKNTPLMTAAQYCGAKVVLRLAQAGADLNAINGSGISPLVMALISNRFEAAEALVSKGAKLSSDQAAMIAASVTDPRAKPIVQKATAKKKK